MFSWIVAIALFIAGLDGEPLYILASGLFAISGQLSLVYTALRKKQQ